MEQEIHEIRKKENKISFDNLGDRMKDYENVSRIKLTKKTPVIIRLDGKAFHSFTKGFKKPFDIVLMSAMEETCKFLCNNIMGCKFAYTQSDEISLLLVDYEKNETQQWFDNNIQKMASVSASMATLAFNKAFSVILSGIDLESVSDVIDIYKKRENTALFDSRVFTLPKEEVCNYFIWRQQDAVRNSIQMVAQSLFSHRELNGKNCCDLQEMMFQKFNVNWNDYPVPQKRGRCVMKIIHEKESCARNVWSTDDEIPIFTQNRDYIDDFVFLGKK